MIAILLGTPFNLVFVMEARIQTLKNKTKQVFNNFMNNLLCIFIDGGSINQSLVDSLGKSFTCMKKKVYHGILEDVPVRRSVSNAAESASAKMMLDCKREADATGTCAKESKVNATAICGINHLNPVETGYL